MVFVGAAHAELLDAVRPDLPDLRHVVLVGEGGDGAAERMPDPPDEADPAVLLYTGGTTGVARGVVLDQRAVMLNRLRSVEFLQPTADWTFLQVVPMYHVAALMPLLKVHLAGAAVVEGDAAALVPTMVVQLLGHPAFRPERLRSLRYLA